MFEAPSPLHLLSMTELLLKFWSEVGKAHPCWRWKRGKTITEVMKNFMMYAFNGWLEDVTVNHILWCFSVVAAI